MYIYIYLHIGFGVWGFWFARFCEEAEYMGLAMFLTLSESGACWHMKGLSRVYIGSL